MDRQIAGKDKIERRVYNYQSGHFLLQKGVRSAGVSMTRMSMGRNGAIDFLKFFFAAQIVFFHGGNFAETKDILFSLGAIGVEFFFIVSGFLMASSAFRRMEQPADSLGAETISFLGHKIKGLLPDVYVAWIVAFLVTCWMDSLSGTNLVKKTIMSVFELMFVNQTGLMGFRSNKVTWYLSAMLLAMLVLYPVLIKTRKTFIYLIALILALFIYGYLYKSGAEGLSAPSHWNGHFTNGFLRAAAGISLGCISYGIVDKIKDIKLTVLGTWLVTMIEAGCYGFVSYASLVSLHSDFDYALVVFLLAGVTITFSRKSYSPRLFQHKCFTWLGVFSFDLFLSHSYWSHAVLKMFPQATYWEILPYYLVIVLATALFVMYVSKLISYIWSRISGRIKDVLIAEEA